MLGSCLSSVPQEDNKCIVDANSLLPETTCTSNFCLAKGDWVTWRWKISFSGSRSSDVCLWQEVSIAQQSDRFGRLLCHLTQHMIWFMALPWCDSASGFWSKILFCTPLVYLFLFTALLYSVSARVCSYPWMSCDIFEPQTTAVIWLLQENVLHFEHIKVL
jgi:hypothetical protein